MPSVSISRLKANLSRYLRAVKRGTEVEILDRGVPVARLVGVRAAPVGDAKRWNRLVKAGVLHTGSGDASAVLGEEPLRTNADFGAALLEDRRDRV